jgi:hypothetical protein
MPMQAQREGEGITPTHIHPAVGGCGSSASRFGPFYPRERPDSCSAGGWLKPVWTDTEHLTPHRHSIPGPSSQYGIRILT